MGDLSAPWGQYFSNKALLRAAKPFWGMLSSLDAHREFQCLGELQNHGWKTEGKGGIEGPSGGLARGKTIHRGFCPSTCCSRSLLLRGSLTWRAAWSLNVGFLLLKLKLIQLTESYFFNAEKYTLANKKRPHPNPRDNTVHTFRSSLERTIFLFEADFDFSPPIIRVSKALS